MKKKRIKNIVPLIIIIICLITGIYSYYKIIIWNIDNKKISNTLKIIEKEQVIEEITDNENTKVINPPEETLSSSNPYWDYMKMNLIDVDLTNLKEKNKDVVGWIKVSGTNINYPFVQSTNNTDYLKKDINKNNNSAGWVFMDYRNNTNNYDKNTIFYAHSRVNGTMFGSLKNILKSDWYNNKVNHVVKLSTENNNTLWQVFSVYTTPVTNDYLEINFNSDEEYDNFLNKLQEKSIYKFDVSLNNLDKIITLSTCFNNDERVVMHAKLIKMEVKNGYN